MASASPEEQIKYLLTLLKHTELPQPDYHGISTDLGISNANVGQKKFKAILKHHAFDLVNKQVVELGGAPVKDTRTGRGNSKPGPNTRARGASAARNRGRGGSRSRGKDRSTDTQAKKSKHHDDDDDDDENDENESDTTNDEESTEKSASTKTKPKSAQTFPSKSPAKAVPKRKASDLHEDPKASHDEDVNSDGDGLEPRDTRETTIKAEDVGNKMMEKDEKDEEKEREEVVIPIDLEETEHAQKRVKREDSAVAFDVDVGSVDVEMEIDMSGRRSMTVGAEE